eukprot:3791124-Amphidinium_carterae.1
MKVSSPHDRTAHIGNDECSTSSRHCQLLVYEDVQLTVVSVVCLGSVHVTQRSSMLQCRSRLIIVEA